MRAVTRGHRIVAPHAERTKRAGISTVIWVREVCGPRRYPHFAKGSEVKRTLKRAVLPAGWEPCRWPTCRTPATSTHQTPFGSQSRPSETRKRRSSDRSPRSTLAICSGRLDSVPLLTEWQLSTNSPASCLSTANGIGRDWIRRPSAERMNSSTDHRRPRN